MVDGQLISPGQIVKMNYIDGYMYGIEMKGGHEAEPDKTYEPKYHTILLVLKGKVMCRINGTKQEFRQRQIVNLPTWSVVGSIKYSSDFHGIVVISDNEILLDIFRSRSPFPLSFSYRFKGMTKGPELSRKETKIIAGDMRNLIGALGNKEHHYLEELAYALFYILITDIANSIWDRFGTGDPGHNMEISRKDSIFREFIELSVSEAGRSCNIEFYADALCVSRQYLSMIVKEKIGTSIGEYLAYLRYDMAVKLLKDKTLTLQQIADRMNFSDQSAFGKFFKRHSGVSPQQYRKNQKNNLLTGYTPVEIPTD